MSTPLVRSSFLALAVTTLLSGCPFGGGGSNNNATKDPVLGDPVLVVVPDPVPPAQPAPVTPLSVQTTSYLNFKSSGLVPQVLPAGPENSLARAYGDFFQSGELAVFASIMTYDATKPLADATPDIFGFWKKQMDGSYVKDTTLLADTTGCIHARKALVADFNGDGRPDVFVACHGYDASPFPGTKNRVVLSQTDGTYKTVDASSDVGFFHGATAGDLNGDGLIDVLAVNNFDGGALVPLINQGNGTFVREAPGRFPSSLGNPHFSVELVDVNEDGKLDVIMAGHEWDGGSAQVLLNPGDGDFSRVTPIVLPAVANEGVVLDFTVTGTGSSRALWLLRTSGGDGTFYQSRVVQKVLWPSLQSSVPYSQRPAQWTAWALPAKVGGVEVITSDLANSPYSFSVPQ